jgi:hypothetical protein
MSRADAATGDPDTTKHNGAAAANRVTTNVTPSADLTVVKSGPASIAALGSITYTIVTTNNGPEHFGQRGGDRHAAGRRDLRLGHERRHRVRRNRHLAAAASLASA